MRKETYEDRLYDQLVHMTNEIFAGLDNPTELHYYVEVIANISGLDYNKIRKDAAKGTNYEDII